VWLLITCTLVTTLYATSLTIANVSLPQIQGALSASPDQISWVVTANLIATAVTIPLAGWIASRFGRRRAMILGIAGFTAATVMCGFATSLAELVLWRVVQSAFGSPLTPISQSVDGHLAGPAAGRTAEARLDRLLEPLDCRRLHSADARPWRAR
jgi:DHA2 family multidrug resistance protein